jgi:hypothetical protein
MESSIKKFEKHPRLKVMTWLFGYSPDFLLNLGMSNRSLAGIRGQNGTWSFGSLVKREKSDKSNVARKGSC